MVRKGWYYGQRWWVRHAQFLDIDKEVGGFHIPVDNPDAVHGFQTAQHLHDTHDMLPTDLTSRVLIVSQHATPTNTTHATPRGTVKARMHTCSPMNMIGRQGRRPRG